MTTEQLETITRRQCKTGMSHSANCYAGYYRWQKNSLFA